MGDSIKLDKGDVDVVTLDPRECEDCGDPATHAVMLDLRAVGLGHSLGEFCADCASVFLEHVRDSLPADPSAPSGVDAGGEG